MNVDEWWPSLDASMREWLIAHNGEAVPEHISERIVAAGGAVTSAGEWAGTERADGVYLSDDAIDWIEATANDERSV